MELTLAIVSRQLWGGEQVLSDPAKRRQYDSMGDVSVDFGPSNLNQKTVLEKNADFWR